MTTCQRIVFHVGDPKCGSTAIQYALNAQQIRVGSETLKLLGRPALNHNYVVLEVTKNGKGAKRVGRLKKELRKKPPQFGVFSAELAATLSPDFFDQSIGRPLYQFAEDFRILSYVRDHASRLVSQFVESVKIGDVKAADGIDLSTYVRNVSRRRVKYVPYFDRYKNWESLYGERLVVRPFLRSAFWNGSILEDFIHSGFGIDGNYEVDRRSAKRNTSPYLKDLMVLRLVQSQLTDFTPQQRHTVGQEILELMPRKSETSSEDSKLEVHRSLAEFMYEEYLDDARQMDHHFFADTPFMVNALEQNLTTAKAEPTSLDPYDHLHEDEVRYVSALTSVIAEMGNAAGTWEHNLRDDRLLRIVEDREGIPQVRMSPA